MTVASECGRRKGRWCCRCLQKPRTREVKPNPLPHVAASSARLVSTFLSIPPCIALILPNTRHTNLTLQRDALMPFEARETLGKATGGRIVSGKEKSKGKGKGKANAGRGGGGGGRGGGRGGGGGRRR